jgi:hypothetical protein
MGLGGPFGTGGDLFKITLQLGQLVQLLQAKGSSRGCVFGPRAETVPTPQITFAADKALAGLQKGLKAWAVLAIHKPDLAKATGQNAGAFDKAGQGRNAIWQALRGVIIGQSHPARGAICTHNGRAQIVG